MAELALCFRDKKEYRSLTGDEIEQLTMAAQGARAIIKVMERYACDRPKDDNGSDGLAVYLNIFNVLGLLMEPLSDFMFNQAEEAASREEEECH
jgi:hypothetical protein